MESTGVLRKTFCVSGVMWFPLMISYRSSMSTNGRCRCRRHVVFVVGENENDDDREVIMGTSVVDHFLLGARACVKNRRRRTREAWLARRALCEGALLDQRSKGGSVFAAFLFVGHHCGRRQGLK